MDMAIIQGDLKNDHVWGSCVEWQKEMVTSPRTGTKQSLENVKET